MELYDEIIPKLMAKYHFTDKDTITDIIENTALSPLLPDSKSIGDSDHTFCSCSDSKGTAQLSQ